MKEFCYKENLTLEEVTSALDPRNFNTEISPRDDFYHYACGGWQKSHPIPAEFSRYGTFDILRENARKQLKDLIINLKNDPNASVQDTLAQKISTLYAQGMDADRLNREGAAPLRPHLDKVEQMPLNDLTEALAEMHADLTSPYFGFGLSTDRRDSDRYILSFGEAGLGLGDRDYYLEDNEHHQRIMQAYREYIVKVLTLAGYSDTEARRIRDNILKLEHELAIHKKTREEWRDPRASFNPISFEDFKEKYDSINWERFLQKFNIKVSEINVSSPGYFEFINNLLPQLSERELRDCFIWETVSGATNLLSDEFWDADFEMFGKIMSGQEEKTPRWKRAMVIPNSMFGEAIGQLYVEKYFPKENKDYMVELVENLRSALGTHIRNLSWMSEATKTKALEKLASLKVKIGYPDKFKTFEEIKIYPEKTYLENVRSAAKWFLEYSLSKLNKPVDKQEWYMTPQTVNAYYSPINNEICFPAAILQPPYFDPKADSSLNYGAIGVVIGHEMTHGFDDQGRRFDKNGNLENWWTEDDEKSFNEMADKLVEQFDSVEVAPGVYAKGRFTLGENIADQGGLRIAMTAYRKACKESGEKPEIISGFTPDQRFYLAYANVWASNIRDEEVLECTKTDPHSLSINRVNETLKNIVEFAKAFDLKEGDALYKPERERVVIW